MHLRNREREYWGQTFLSMSEVRGRGDKGTQGRKWLIS